MSDGKIIFVSGKSRMGKSWWLMQQLKKWARCIVWDIKGAKDEFTGFVRVSSRVELVKLLASHHNKPLKIAYHVSRDRDIKREFDYWANIAHDWAEEKACAIAAEELSDVTSPNKAPAGWGMLLRKVLCTGSDVYALTQRPAESDKTAIGNASIIHTHKMKRVNDIKYIANEMGVESELVASLNPFDFIESYDDKAPYIYRYKK